MKPDIKTVYDELFRQAELKYTLSKGMVKAISYCENQYGPNGYRFEPKYWENYMKKNPTWANREPSEVSASYGLMQIMYDVFYKYGFRGKAAELYDPAFNIETGARYFRELLDEATREQLYLKFPYLTPMRVALARYNGGPTGNPDADGNLRNESYVDGVMAAWTKIHFQPELMA
jgi:hypothetical protein